VKPENEKGGSLINEPPFYSKRLKNRRQPGDSSVIRFEKLTNVAAAKSLFIFYNAEARPRRPSPGIFRDVLPFPPLLLCRKRFGF